MNLPAYLVSVAISALTASLQSDHVINNSHEYTSTGSLLIEEATHHPDGLRFATVDSMEHNCVYIPWNETAAIHYTLRRGSPGPRAGWPSGRELILLEAPPVKNLPQRPLFAAELPEPRPDRLLCVITRSKRGYLPVFIEDSDLHPGMVLVVNATTNTYLLELAETAEGHEPQTRLEPQARFLFSDKSGAGKLAMGIGAILKHQIMVKGEKSGWLPYRKFMLLRSNTRAVVKIIAENETGAIMIHDLLLFPERP